jgi:hypothetical protein
MSTLEKVYPKPDRSNFVPNKYNNDQELPESDLGSAKGVLFDGRPYLTELWATEGYTLITFFFSTIDIDKASSDQILALLHNALEEEGVPKQYWLLNQENMKKIKDASGNSMYSITFVVGEPTF